MGPLERLRSWLARLVGDSDSPADGTREGSNSGPPGRDSGGSRLRPRERQGLDPSGATETRTVGQDDAVTALRETRRTRDEAGEPGPDPGPDTGDGDNG